VSNTDSTKVLARDRCIHKYLKSGRTDCDHCTYVGKALRASQERGGLEAILRKRTNAPHGSVGVNDMSKEELRAYYTKRKAANRAKKKAELAAMGKVYKSL
jgi:hypothetical protein